MGWKRRREEAGRLKREKGIGERGLVFVFFLNSFQTFSTFQTFETLNSFSNFSIFKLFSKIFKTI
jgi:hypothetical protein